MSSFSELTLKIEAAYSYETIIPLFTCIWTNTCSMGISFDIRRADLQINLPLIFIFTCFLGPRDLDFSIGNFNFFFLSRIY
jgi:hypothetical protein